MTKRSGAAEHVCISNINLKAAETRYIFHHPTYLAIPIFYGTRKFLFKFSNQFLRKREDFVLVVVHMGMVKFGKGSSHDQARLSSG